MRVIDVELNAVEEVLDLPGLRCVAVDEVLGLASDEDLTGHGDFGG